MGFPTLHITKTCSLSDESALIQMLTPSLNVENASSTGIPRLPVGFPALGRGLSKSIDAGSALT